MTLTPEQIQKVRIAVAKTAGWKMISEGYGAGEYGWPPGVEIGNPPIQLPNYPLDRNAIAGVLEGMDCNLRNEFVSHLWRICGNDESVNFWTEYNFRGLWSCINATALQLCLAYLATKRLPYLATKQLSYE